jgi:hypothetical protein
LGNSSFLFAFSFSIRMFRVYMVHGLSYDILVRRQFDICSGHCCHSRSSLLSSLSPLLTHSLSQS